MSKQKVLIVDDEPDILELLEITLLRMGLEVNSAEDFTTATRLLKSGNFNLCLTDMKLPDGDGISLVEHIQQLYPAIPVAVITAHANMELAIKAMKSGAFDFVSKPVSLEKLRNLVDQALNVTKPSGKSTKKGSVSDNPFQIIGESPIMTQLKQSISKFARSQAPVFVQGESGTGKELVARQIHLQSARCESPFIAVNCGAIPSELMESELFGHLKGSFTGAIADNQGLFRAANGGTLFLDEIADLPLAMQVKLLRVIQEKTVRSLGSQQEETIDVRFISASHKNLEQMVNENSFRQDLYYRINVIGVTVPPLNVRSEDIPELCDYMLQKHSEQMGEQISLQAETLKTLMKYSFPGNIRELENILERACALCEQNQITVSDLQLPEAVEQDGATNNLNQQTQQREKQALQQALELNHWNQSAAARQLGITLRQLRYRVEKFEI